MSRSIPIITTLENLPDEILLLICRYLSPIDTLFAFYDLNSRLSQTISGCYEHVFIGQTSYPQLTHMCSSILPEIGLHVRSLIISNEWVGLVSEFFLEYFGERMSSTFTQLESLTLVKFTAHSLRMFLDCLTNLSKLTELNIRSLAAQLRDPKESWILLHQIFTCNNSRFRSIAFDRNSVHFFGKNTDDDRSYSNVEKLTINLMTLEDLHDLLPTLPKIHSLDVIVKWTTGVDHLIDQQLSPVYTVTKLRLRVETTLNFEKLKSVLKRFPNVENLSLWIPSNDDYGLAVSPEFFEQLSSLPLKIFKYFLYLYQTSINETTLHSTWQQFRSEPICFESIGIHGCMLYTLPPDQTSLFVPHLSMEEIGNSKLMKNYGPTLKDVDLETFGYPLDISETFVILARCPRIERLKISMNGDIHRIIFNDRAHIGLEKLPCLISITLCKSMSMMPKAFSVLVQASPKLCQLTLSLANLKFLFDDECSCGFLKQRITHLKIDRGESVGKLDDILIPRLASAFPNLKYLCIVNGHYCNGGIELSILAVVDCLSQWSLFVSLGIFGITEPIDEKWGQRIKSLISEHMSANGNDRPFFVDYTNKDFHLWL